MPPFAAELIPLQWLLFSLVVLAVVNQPQHFGVGSRLAFIAEIVKRYWRPIPGAAVELQQAVVEFVGIIRTRDNSAVLQRFAGTVCSRQGTRVLHGNTYECARAHGSLKRLFLTRSRPDVFTGCGMIVFIAPYTVPERIRGFATVLAKSDGP